MDPISIAALSAAIAGLVKPSAEQAGSGALATLKRLATRVRGRREELDIAVLDGQPDDTQVAKLAAALADLATEDPAFDRDLRTWLASAQAIVGSDGVSNVNAGTVSGPLIQGRDFHGPITIE